MTSGTYRRGYHPASLSNLNKEGAKPRYEQKKKSHQVLVTPDGWEGLRTLALEHGVSISELVELIGRRELTLCPSEREESVEPIE
jgi:hypothetical protein